MAEKLLVRLKAGNSDAFQELLRQYYHLVETSIRRQLEGHITPPQARALARAVFARAHVYSGDLRHDDQLSIWLARLTNRVVAEYRDTSGEDDPPHVDVNSDNPDLPPW